VAVLNTCVCANTWPWNPHKNSAASRMRASIPTNLSSRDESRR
jgi:hypothetical protein